MTWILRHLRSRAMRNEWNIPVRNFGCVVDRRIYRGATPFENGYKALKDFGIETVICLLDSPGTQDDGLRARAAGLRWYHLPLSSLQAPSRDRVRQWFEWTRNEALAPLFIHSLGGRHRVGGLVAAYRISIEGVDRQKAILEAERFGFYPERGHHEWLEFMKSFSG